MLEIKIVQKQLELHKAISGDGVPIHAEANGWYWISGYLGEPWIGQWGPKDQREECLEHFASHCRIPVEEAKKIIQGVANTGDPVDGRKVWAAAVEAMKPRWQKEADECVGEPWNCDIARNTMAAELSRLHFTVFISEKAQPGIDHRDEKDQKPWPHTKWEFSIGRTGYKGCHNGTWKAGVGHIKPEMISERDCRMEPALESVKKRGVWPGDHDEAARLACLVANTFTEQLSYPRPSAAPDDRAVKLRPDPVDIIGSCMQEAVDSLESFPDWCSNFGYDEDSRKAEATYNECRKTLADLRGLRLTDDEIQKLADLASQL